MALNGAQVLAVGFAFRACGCGTAAGGHGLESIDSTFALHDRAVRGGAHTLDVPFGDFTEPAPGRVMYFQALCVDSTGRALLTGPQQVLLAST